MSRVVERGEFEMSTVTPSIGGRPVTIRLAMKMEDALQAIAIRAACFVGELGVPFSDEIDGHDYGATHVIASLGDEPIGAVRVRWFRTFAMIDRLAVLQRFRGHRVGHLLLERSRILAESRGCNMLYAQVLPPDLDYFAKQGWWRLLPERQRRHSPNRIVAIVRSVEQSKPRSVVAAPEAVTLRPGPGLDSTAFQPRRYPS